MSENDETALLLKSVPGGAALLNWFSGKPNFGDAEVLAFHLDRKKPSTLILEAFNGAQWSAVTFVLGDWIDIQIRGFSQQNVIGGLILRRAGEREIEPWEIGVTVIPGEFEMELRPVFGAYGIIRATLLSVAIKPA